MEGNKLTLGRQRQRGLQQREPRSPQCTPIPAENVPSAYEVNERQRV